MISHFWTATMETFQTHLLKHPLHPKISEILAGRPFSLGVGNLSLVSFAKCLSAALRSRKRAPKTAPEGHWAALGSPSRPEGSTCYKMTQNGPRFNQLESDHTFNQPVPSHPGTLYFPRRFSENTISKFIKMQCAGRWPAGLLELHTL